MRVTRTSDQLEIAPDYHHEYFSLAARSKSRRKAYDLFKSRYSAILNLLKEQDILPNEITLVKSKVKSRHLTRTREWEFRVQFGVAVSEVQIHLLEQRASLLGVRKLNTFPEINYLEEKWIALKLFLSAKEDLSRKLTGVNT